VAAISSKQWGDMASVSLYQGSEGRAPSRVQAPGVEPVVGVRGKAPLKLKEN